MPDNPNRSYRRFFQFRLSTWLVLVGIVAWAMATGVLVPANMTFKYGSTASYQPPLIAGWTFVDMHKSQDCTYFVYEGNRLNWRIVYPALALVAFIGWKTFWLIRERRRERLS